MLVTVSDVVEDALVVPVKLVSDLLNTKSFFVF